MDGTTRTHEPFLEVRRDFESSRLEDELLALAYEQLLPMLQPPLRRPTGGRYRVPTPATAAATR